MTAVRFLVLAAAALIAFSLQIGAADSASPSPSASLEVEEEVQHAPVVVDGRPLFNVAGIASTFPADARASRIAGRIAALGDARDFDPAKLRVEGIGGEFQIVYDRTPIVVITELDARLVGLQPDFVATAYMQRIAETVQQYREERTVGFLRLAAVRLAAAVALAIAAAALVVLGARWIDQWLDRRYRSRIQAVGIQSFQIVRAERIWSTLRGSIAALRALALVVIVLIALEYALSLFPWTRLFAAGVVSLVVEPLRKLGAGFVHEIPDLMFLLILVIVVRYLLRMLRLFFDEVARGRVALHDFDPDWSEPTYKLLRILVVAFALVVAYPYIPGSSSEAFKGVSLFLGIVFSLGSTTAIANMIAGYALTYRRAFKVGDRIRIGETVGDVIRTRLQVTHLRTAKNEEVIVPNSQLLNNAIVNYSALAREKGLVISVTAGIGYETPWRQVEAMLLLAAERTEGVLREPRPFVHQLSLGDFCINYELNAFIRDAQAMLPLRTALSRNVLDAFNEYGVQIMTPNYERDTPEPKIVPRDKWHVPPAPNPGTAAGDE